MSYDYIFGTNAPRNPDLSIFSNPENNETLSDTFTIVYRAQPPNGERDYNIRWKRSAKNSARILVNETFIATIANLAKQHQVRCELSINCFTTWKQGNEVFRASPLYMGSQWYDWCIVRYADDDGTTTLCPGKLLGFFKSNDSGGLPTEYLIDDLESNGDIDAIRKIKEEKLKDETTYAVIHSCAVGYQESEFIKTL